MIIISALYLVSLYGTQAVLLGPILLSDGSGDLDIPWGLLPPAVIANLILAVVAIIFLIKRVRRVQADLSARRRLNHLALAMKLLTIPFFITHLQIWSMMLAAFLVIPGLQILLPFGFLGVAFAYSVVLATSALLHQRAVCAVPAGQPDGEKVCPKCDFSTDLCAGCNQLSRILFPDPPVL